MAYISRDPFSRQELHRKQVPALGSTCAWCGNLNRHGKLYQYRTETDGGRVFEDSRRFCSVSCYRTFYS